MAGYWVVKGTVVDNDAYQEYVKLWTPIAKRYRVKMLAGGGAHDTREGADFARVLVIEFPSYEQALACYDDSDYQAAMKLALAAYDPAKPRELVIVEGS